MTGLAIFNYAGNEVRATLINGEPWFVAADVCRILQHSSTTVAMQMLDADDKQQVDLRKTDIPSLNMVNPVVWMISEPGVYELAFRSNAGGAKAFKRWITHEVLPEIRKTGSFTLPEVEVAPLTGLEYALRLVDAERRAEQGQKFQRAIEAGDGLMIRAFHKKYFSAMSERDFFTYLYDSGLLINQRGKGTRRENGTFRDGSQHRHPSFRGKPWMYLHTFVDDRGFRRENAHVRPGGVELQFRDYLAKQGLPANENTTGMFAIGGGKAS